MKRHVEFEHFELVTTYVEQLAIADNISRSQAMGDVGCRTIQLTKKRSKITPSVIFAFFGSTTPYKKQDEAQKLFLEDLVLLTTKGLFPLSTCQNVWMWRLALRLDPKVVFLYRKTLFEEMFLAMVTCLNLHVQPLFNVALVENLSSTS
jgi:hypothetical protein